MSGVIPNIIIAGVQKAGTTSIANMLASAPGVFLPNQKEPEFWHIHDNPMIRRMHDSESAFSDNYYSGVENYERAYDAALKHDLLCDASTIYFRSALARERLYEASSDTKVILCLRDPAYRAYSAYNFLRKTGQEPLSRFQDALDAEPARLKDGMHYIYHYQENGFYSDAVGKWIDTFGVDNVKVLFFERFLKNPQELQDLFLWLGLQVPESIELPSANPSGEVAGFGGQFLQRIAYRKGFANTGIKRFLPSYVRSTIIPRVTSILKRRLDSRIVRPEPLEQDLYNTLTEIYAEDRRALEILLKTDLSNEWMYRQPRQKVSI